MAVLSKRSMSVVGLAIAFAMTGCEDEVNGGNDLQRVVPSLPQLSPATAGALLDCELLIGRFTFPATQVTSSARVAAGTLSVGGTPIGEHCVVTGTMNERTGLNGTYAIGFEMRLPLNWNGRFYHQGNGGADGAVAQAVGPQSGGGAVTNALSMGFAVLSSDAGHNSAQNGAGPQHFGLDPQARIDYGYAAVGALTPMAKALVRAAYGRAPDRSYFGGCSNGGRHALVAASRYPDQYDGILAGDPGYDLARAGMGVFWSTQQYAGMADQVRADGLPDLNSALSVAERTYVSNKIIEKCDALDGASDGMVLNSSACQTTFNFSTDIATCSAGRTGACLTTNQKTLLAKDMAGPRNTAGTALYTNWPWDPGIGSAGWSSWKTFINPVLGASAVPYIFMAPPVQVPNAELLRYSINYNWDVDAPRISATNATYAEASTSFMSPPDPANLWRLKSRGAKLLIYHGTGDAAFSVQSTNTYYDNLRAQNAGDASNFARYFQVPAMGHCSGGPATDQFDMITPLVNWVERGQAPDLVIAGARGPGTVGGVNTELPATWSPTRKRPLCPYPTVAHFTSGDVEAAASFSCR